MYKTAARKHRHSDYDLNDDLLKIKNAIADAAFDVRGKAGEMLTEKSLDFRDTVTNYAEKKPFKTIGLSILAGVLVGFLLRK